MLFTRSFEAVLDFIQFALLFCSSLPCSVSSSCASRSPSCRGLSRLGIPGTPAVFPARDCLHDVLSVDGTAAAVIPGHFDDDLGLLIYAVFRKRAAPDSATASASPE